MPEHSIAHVSKKRHVPGAPGDKHALWDNCLAGCLSVGRLKDLGNQAFKAGQNRFAKPKWERAIRLMDRLLDAETEEQVGPQRLGLWAVQLPVSVMGSGCSGLLPQAASWIAIWYANIRGGRAFTPSGRGMLLVSCGCVRDSC